MMLLKDILPLLVCTSLVTLSCSQDHENNTPDAALTTTDDNVQVLDNTGLTASKEEVILSKMTLEQKIHYVSGVGFDPQGLPPEIDKVPGAAGYTVEYTDLGIPSIVLADGPAGLRISPRREGSDRTYYATAFPVATVLSSSWDTELASLAGKAIGTEVREYGVDLYLAPGLNIHRDPLGGRNFEYYTEDPPF